MGFWDKLIKKNGKAGARSASDPDGETTASTNQQTCGGASGWTNLSPEQSGFVQGKNIGPVHQHYYQSSPAPGPQPPMLDKKTIIQFDMDVMEETFRKVLKPRTGLFGFSMRVTDTDVCNRFLLERLKKEYREKCGREVNHRRVYLIDDDKDAPDQPVQRLEKAFDDSVLRWFHQRPRQNLMVSFWNNYGEPYGEILRASWEKMKTAYNDSLESNGDTLVTVWIDVNRKTDDPVVKMDDKRFTVLTFPETFKENEVRAFLLQKLTDRVLPEKRKERIDNYVVSIRDYKFDFYKTFCQLNEIWNQLNKKNNKGGAERYAYS